MNKIETKLTRVSSQFNTILCILVGKLPFVFLSFALLNLLFLSFFNPPFNNPDELSHIGKAYQMLKGSGRIDKNLYDCYATFSKIHTEKNFKLTQDKIGEFQNLHWSKETLQLDFKNTEAYPFFLYLPQAIILKICMALDTTIVKSLSLTRFGTGCLAVIISTLSLFICRRGKVIMFSLLLLPSSIALYASASQDSMIIAITALIVSLFSQQIYSGRAFSIWQLLLIFISLLVITLARPPYIAFAALLFYPNCVPKIGKFKPTLVLLTIFIALFCIAGGWLQAGALKKAAFTQAATYNENLFLILYHPFTFALYVFNTVKTYFPSYCMDFIGVIGWLDVHFSHNYYIASGTVLLISVLYETCDLNVPLSSPAFTLLAALSSVFFVMIAEYIIWTPPLQTTIEGIQARYFLPPILLLSIAIPKIFRFKELQLCMLPFIIIFPLLSTLSVYDVVIRNYYIC
jgi:uncharacterized membrane protein